MSIEFTLNGSSKTVDAPPEMPLLWVLRDLLDLKGTKFGCGRNFCGACTVHVDGVAERSCRLPVSRAAGKKITTIEGISLDGTHPVQLAWQEIDVPQCGYCQAGQIMAALGAAGDQPEAGRCGDRRGDEREPVPLRHLHADPHGDPSRCGDGGGRHAPPTANGAEHRQRGRGE